MVGEMKSSIRHCNEQILHYGEEMKQVKSEITSLDKRVTIVERVDVEIAAKFDVKIQELRDDVSKAT